jgi:hypothetical protein
VGLHRLDIVAGTTHEIAGFRPQTRKKPQKQAKQRLAASSTRRLHAVDLGVDPERKTPPRRTALLALHLR